jgi:signal transduction histidine kinase
LEAEEEQRKQAAHIRTLEDIIAIAAHDLRQPLTILVGRLQLLARSLRRGATVDDSIARMDGLIAQARRAVALSEALLDVARMESGQLTMEHAPFDLAALARQITDDTRLTAPTQTLQLVSPDSVPLVGDARRLAQVLRNLLENAVKYAPAENGPILLTLTPDAESGASGEVHIEVHDSGPGVTGSSLDRLFDRNYRAPEAIEQGVKGSGLGLYIVRQIVEAHGGRASAENAPEGGLIVRLLLPMAPYDAPR